MKGLLSEKMNSFRDLENVRQEDSKYVYHRLRHHFSSILVSCSCTNIGNIVARYAEQPGMPLFIRSSLFLL